MMRRFPQETVTHSPGLDFFIWRSSPQVMANPHTHPDVEINFLCRGKIRYFLAGRFVDITPGEMVIFWAGMPHQTLKKTAEVEGVWLTLPLIWLLRWKHTRTLAAHLLRGGLLIEAASDSDKAAFDQWEQDFSNSGETLRDIIVGEIENRLSRLSLALGETGVRRPRLSAGSSHMEKILRYLAEHYREEITVNDMAEAVRLHPKYLLVLFRRTCGMKLWDYVVRLRLAHAQRLLLTTDRTVADLAQEAGFNSLSAFYHAFRKHGPAGTPADFRAGLSPTGSNTLSRFDTKEASRDACRHASTQD